MKILFSTLIICTSFFTSSASAATANIICNTCDSASDFINVAEIQNPGFVMIVNPDKGLAYSYRVLREPMDGTTLIPKAVPAEVRNAITKYQSIKQSFENVQAMEAQSFDSGQFQEKQANSNILMRSDFSIADILSSSSHPLDNGCGAEGKWISNIIPNYPFFEACNNHDICYAGTAAKSICDISFKQDMQQIIDGMLEQAGEWEKILLSKLYESQKNLYYNVVKDSAAAKSAFCNATQTEEAPECAPNEHMAERNHSINLTPKASGLGGIEYTMDCELWSFPNGNGGYYTITKNCTVYSIQN